MARGVLLPLLLFIAVWAQGGFAVTSRARQYYEHDCMSGLNQQINDHLQASYLFKAMAAHFSHDSRALPGFAKFFSKASKEKREHADELIEYQIKRGGEAELYRISAPAKNTWANGLEAMQNALEREGDVHTNLLHLHSTCSSDPTMQDLLESKFLKEQLKSVKKLTDHVTVLTRLHTNNPQLGEYMFDEELD